MSMMLLLWIEAAYAIDDVPGARRGAMGGSGVAALGDDSAVTLNPAALGLVERFDVDLQGVGGTEKLLGFGASAVDARTGPVALGVTWLYSRDAPAISAEDLPGWVPSGDEVSNTRRDHLLAAGLSLPLLDRRVALGIGGGLSLYNNDLGGTGTVGDLDAGVAAVPVEGMSVGVSARDLVPFNHELDAPPSFVAGAEVAGKIGAIAAEGGLSTGAAWAPIVRGGAELRAALLRVRAGGAMVGSDTSFGWGLGVENDAGGLEYAMTVPIGGGPWTHSIGLRLRGGAGEQAPF